MLAQKGEGPAERSQMSWHSELPGTENGSGSLEGLDQPLHLDLDPLLVAVGKRLGDSGQDSGAVAELEAGRDGEVLVPLAPP